MAALAVSDKAASSSASPTRLKKNIIVCWEFDWSLVNQNSDYFVHEKLFGADGYTNNIFPAMRKKAQSEGTSVFTDFMDKYGWPNLFSKFNLNPESFSELVRTMPIFPENLEVVRTIDSLSQRNNSGRAPFLIQQYIISNANQVLIDVILEANGLRAQVFKGD